MKALVASWGVFVATLLGLVAWSVVRHDPTGGEPVATVEITQSRPDGQMMSSAGQADTVFRNKVSARLQKNAGNTASN